MNLLPIELVTLAGDQLVTDTMRVAQHFGKQHRHVLRAVDNLDCSQEFRVRNFGQTVAYRPNPSGGKPISGRVIQMTKDGFMFLAMGFTGHEAALIKEAYIAAFNSMAEQLERRDLSMLSKLLDYEVRQRDSSFRAKFGSGLMNKRRRELPALRQEERELRAVAQAPLFQLVKGGA